MTKEPPLLRDKFVSDSIRDLHRANQNLTEEIKVLEKRFDFMQDEQARMVIEQQALMKSMKVWTKIATELLDKEEKPKPSTKDIQYQ